MFWLTVPERIWSTVVEKVWWKEHEASQSHLGGGAESGARHKASNLPSLPPPPPTDSLSYNKAPSPKCSVAFPGSTFHWRVFKYRSS